MLWRKCLIRLALAASVAIPVSSAVWPPALQEFSRSGPERPLPPGDAIQAEYGLVEGAEATYEAGKRRFTASAWRYQDATGAIAASQARLGSMVRGNYVIAVTEGSLSKSEISTAFLDLVEFREPTKPTLPTYLPPRIATGTLRYVLGEQSLRAYLPSWTSSEMGFDLGAEAEVADITVGGSPARLVLIRYATPQIARMKATQLARPARFIKRSGPLLAVLSRPDGGNIDPTAATSALASVEFRAVLIESEPNPNRFVKDSANMLLGIFALAGILLAVCLGGGLAFGLVRVLFTRSREATGQVQTLHLRDL